MTAQEKLQPPPEADLIRIARLARGLSPERAADLTPIRLGGARWRHIERGYEPKRPPNPVRAPDKTLAHMAHTVGVSPERLEGAGRPGAADILREILRSDEAQTAEPSPLSTREEEILAEMVASAAEGFDLTPDQLDAAITRARQLITERRRGRQEGGGGSWKPRAS